jgi:hypothetical protein
MGQYIWVPISPPNSLRNLAPSPLMTAKARIQSKELGPAFAGTSGK